MLYLFSFAGINPRKITVPMTCKDIYGNEKYVDYYIEEYEKCKCNQCTGVTSYQEGGGYP